MTRYNSILDNDEHVERTIDSRVPFNYIKLVEYLDKSEFFERIGFELGRQDVYYYYCTKSSTQAPVILHLTITQLANDPIYKHTFLLELGPLNEQATFTGTAKYIKTLGDLESYIEEYYLNTHPYYPTNE